MTSPYTGLADRRTVDRRQDMAAMGATADQYRHRAKLAEDQRDMLLVELKAAHRVIPVLLAEMTSEQKFRLMRRGDLADISPEGLTRYHERAAAIAKCGGAA